MTARAQLKPQDDAFVADLAAPAPTGPLGGPVAAMHAAIAERLALDPARVVFEPSRDFRLDENVLQPISRAAGPVLLVAAVLGIVARFAL
jgi:hypothetical protein